MDTIRDLWLSLRNKLAERGLNDPQLIGVIVLGIIGLAVVYNGAQVVQQNYELLEKIAVLKEENRVLELQNRNRVLEIEYYKTPEFAELKARRVNGVAAEGESVYTISDEVALAALKTSVDQGQEEVVAAKPSYQQNFEAWLDFFFGG